MKRNWLLLPILCVAAFAYAQEAVEEGPAVVVEPEITDQTVAVESEITNQTIVVDTVEYTYVKDGVSYASPMAQFAIQGTDDQSGLDKIFVSLDNGEYAPYKGSISFQTEGPHSLIYQFIDKVGNISYSQVFNVFIDATAPRVLTSMFEPTPYVASGNTYIGTKTAISLKSFDDLSGVAFMEYSADDKPMVRYTNAFTAETLGYTENTQFVLNYQAVDMVSNVTVPKKMRLVLDAKAPVVNIFAKVFELNGIRYISTKDIISVEAFDADTKVQKIFYAINDGSFEEYDPAIGVRLTKAGEYDIKAKAVDVVGNMSEEVVYSVVADVTAPAGAAAYAGTAFVAASESTSAQETAPTEEAPVEEAAPPAEEAPIEAADAPQNSTEVPAGEIAPPAAE